MVEGRDREWWEGKKRDKYEGVGRKRGEWERKRKRGKRDGKGREKGKGKRN